MSQRGTNNPEQLRKILLVEDDVSLGTTLRERLGEDYEIHWAQSKKEALAILGARHFDLVILDIGLPDGTGFEIAEALRLKKEVVHFIFLTAQGDAESRLQGYELGAEEFIPKPFHLKELLLRVEHVMNKHSLEKVLLLPHCQVHLSEMKVIRKSGGIEYPPVKDMQVLALLVQKAPDAVSRDEILDQVWGAEKDLNHRTVDNTIVRLKKVIEDHDDQVIRSVRGVGYQWIYRG